ncbi:MAG: outer membrane protein assembly factor BamA [Spirochaetaceae bacterium]|jgi:outer membrane protein insertion porin family|nr:outer membrane protein assembly factor BamA [Spirochaetaceae bacterium]
MRIWFTLGLLVLAVFSGFAQESGEWYQGKPIKDIQFEGLKYVSPEELEGIVESFKGRAFSDDVFWELSGQLYALEFFELITPSALPSDTFGTGVLIKFTVKERPIVSRITFEGNAHLRRSELLETISLKLNDVANQIKLRADETAISAKYLEKGYPDIKVAAKTEQVSEGNIHVTFQIREGEKISIEAFVFEGNSIFSNRTLQGQLSLKAKGLVQDGAFQEAKLIADQETLRQYYHDRGYLDAEITDVIRSLRKDEKGYNLMTITFKIREGGQYKFGGVAFEGNQIFSSEELSKQINSKVGETANARRIEMDLQRVADLYYENGYIFNGIGRSENRDPNAGIVTYTISIVERGRAHIENILVKGNKKTKDYVILREIPLESGDVFSKTKVMEGWRNLMNLQYFTMVAPDTPPGTTDSLMDLIINVEEQPTTDIQAGITFSGSTDPGEWPVSFLLKWTDRNFIGTGNSLGASLNISAFTQSATVEYTHRWFANLPLAVGFDFTALHSLRYGAMRNRAPYFNGDEDYAFPEPYETYQEYVNANKSPPSENLMQYDQWRLSLGASTGYRFGTAAGVLGVGGGIRAGIVLNSYDEDLYNPFSPAVRNRNNAWTPAFSLPLSVYLDNRDLYYDPSKGFYAIQRLGLYGFFDVELEHYMRSDTKAEYFITFLKFDITDTYTLKFIFGIHSGVSFIFPQPGRQLIVEPANQLAVDGMFTGRGWTSEYYNKGYALWENWAEIRIPFVPGILAWDFFFDAAAVKLKPEDLFTDFSIEDMRFSFGGALRLLIPQLPIRLGIGKRFKVVDGAVEWQKGNIFDTLDLVFSFTLSTY